MLQKRILDHVEAITQHRDTALVDVSIVKSLRELLPTCQVKMYDVVLRKGRYQVALTVWTEGERIACHPDVISDFDLEELALYPELAASLEQGGVTTRDGNNETPDDKLGDKSGDKLHRQWMPVFIDKIPMACLELAYSQTPTATQQEVAQGLLGLYRNYLSLLHDSQLDTLTGLANRKTFDFDLTRLLTAISSELQRPAKQKKAERRNGAVDDNWLVIIDIDHFKRVNDRFGHIYGDDVLILVANIMRSAFRQQDRLFRFGGEEFVVLLRHVTYENACNTLERFRQKVADQDFPQTGQITISAGFAKIRSADTPTAILGYADEALYYAKENGRNQVCHYETLVKEGRLPVKHVNTEAEFF
jgi:diguanylate cyclase (GGDEF)-like protein